MSTQKVPNLPNVKTLSIRPHVTEGVAPTLLKAMLMDNGDIEIYDQIGWNGEELSQSHRVTIYAKDGNTSKLWKELPDWSN